MSSFWTNIINKRKFYDGWDVFSIDERDFGGSHIDKIPTIKWHKKPEFNQYKDPYTKHSCTITNAVMGLCYNFGIEFKKNYIYEAIEFCEKNWWYNHRYWRDTNKAMQYVRKRAKIKRGKEFPYVRLRYTDPKAEEYFDKGYLVWFSFNGNNKYILDYAKEWILDWTSFGKRQRWHRTNMYKETWVYRVWDSESWFKFNDYWLANFHWLVEDWTYFARLYIRTPEESLIWSVSEVKRLVKMNLLVEENVKNNGELFNLSNDKEYQNWLHSVNNKHRAKIKDIETEMKKYNW